MKTETRTTRQSGHLIVSLFGPMNESTVPSLQKELLAQAGMGVPSLVVNMKDVRHVDSSGIALLTRLHREMVGSRRNFALLKVPSQILKILNGLGLKEYFRIENRVEDLTGINTPIASPTPDADEYILIVEDENVVARDIQQILQRNGYSKTKITSSGEEALRLVRTRVPDVVVLDITLEKGFIDGIETAALIKQIAEVPIVFVTAHGEARMRDRAGVVHPEGYLLKPLNTAELRETIRMSLHNDRPRGSGVEVHGN